MAEINAQLAKAYEAGAEVEPDLIAAYERALRDAGRTAAKRYSERATLLAAAKWEPPTVESVLGFAANTTRIRTLQHQMLERIAGAATAEILGISFTTLHPVAQEMLDKLGLRAAAISQGLRTPVAAAIARGWAEGRSVPQTAALIRSAVANLSSARATMLARTDLIGLSNGSGHLAVEQLNEASVKAGHGTVIKTKTWVSAGDKRVRPSHQDADGQTVPIDQPFTVGGRSLAYPGDPSGPDEEVIACRCTELFDETVTTVANPAPAERPGIEGRTDLANQFLGNAVDTQQRWKLAGGAYAPERLALHREIAKHFLQSGRAVPATQTPRATFMAGGSGAGKSTVKKAITERGDLPKNYVDIDPDAIKEMLPEYQALLEAGDTMAARLVHEESSDLAKAILEEAGKRRFNVVIDGTGDGEPGKFTGKLIAQEAKGYEVDVFVVDIPTAEALARAAARAARTGRYVPEADIRDIHRSVSASFEEWRDLDQVKRWQVWANDERPPRLIAQSREGAYTLIDRDRFNQFVRKADESLDRPDLSLTQSYTSRGINPKFLDRELLDAVDEAMGNLRGALPQRATDKLAHLTDGVLPVGVRASLNGGAWGQYWRQTVTHHNGDPKEILLSERAPHPGLTLLHELGHYIDNLWVRNGNKFYASIESLHAPHASTADAWSGFFAAFTRTHAYQSLQDTLDFYRRSRDDLTLPAPERDVAAEAAKHIEYLLSPQEVWARAFAQFVIRRFGNDRLKGELKDKLYDELENNKLRTQWQGVSFDELDEAVERLLRDFGLLDEGLPPVTGSGHRLGVVAPRLLSSKVRRQVRASIRRAHAFVHEVGDDLSVAATRELRSGNVVAGGTHHEKDRPQWEDGRDADRRPELGSGDPLRRGGVGRSRGRAALGDGGGVPGVHEAPALGGVPGAPGGAADPGAAASGAVAASTSAEAALTSGEHTEVTMSVTEVETAVATRWFSDIAFEGLSTGDGRYMAEDSLRWREPPLTLMSMIETPEFGGHAGAQVAGRMDTFGKDSERNMDGDRLPSGVVAVRSSGEFDLEGDRGGETARMVDDKTMTGISVDLTVHEWGFRDPDTGDILQPDELSEEQWEKAFMGEYEFAVLDGEIMAATVCPTPAFADARIAIVAASFVRPHVWIAGSEYADANGVKAGQIMTTLTASIATERALTAAAAPVAPPRQWFYRPEGDGPTPITITENGELYGHIALWESCHTGFMNGQWSQCITPPRSKTSYSQFHVGEIETEEGDLIPIGKLTYDTGHAPTNLGRVAARCHYDETGAVGAYVRAEDGKFGVWVSGAVRSDISPEGLRDLRANPPSGDWRTFERNLELVAALAVVSPGFPVPRSQMALAASADGERVEVVTLILVASADDYGDPGDETDAEEALILDALIAHGEDAYAVLIDGE